MDAYVYAPKDDPKHRATWRTPYDADELAGFATLVEFVFAPPAIANAVAKYITFAQPQLDANAIAVGSVIFGIASVITAYRIVRRSETGAVR